MNSHRHHRRCLCHFQSIYSDKWLCNIAWVVMNDVQHEDENWDKLQVEKIELREFEKKNFFPLSCSCGYECEQKTLQSIPATRKSINVDIKLVVSFRLNLVLNLASGGFSISISLYRNVWNYPRSSFATRAMHLSETKWNFILYKLIPMYALFFTAEKTSSKSLECFSISLWFGKLALFAFILE